MTRTRRAPSPGIAVALLAAACGAPPPEPVAPVVPVTSVALVNGPKPAPPVAVDDFALLDTDGVFHRLGRYADRAAVVLLVQGNGCPIARHAAIELRALKERYGPRGVSFLLLNPQTQDTVEEIRAEAEEFGLADFPILVDDSQLVAESLGVERTGEAFVIDAAKKELLYRGPVDDRVGYEGQRARAARRWLADALDALLAGEPVRQPAVPNPGCIVHYVGRDEGGGGAPSYTDEIAPILARRCVGCHHAGGTGPFAMSSHAKVRGWSRMIREVVLTGRMPPGRVDPAFEDRLVDVNVLSAEERRALVRWIDAGAPFDGAADRDPLAALPPPADAWELGEPDVLFRLPRQEVPATGVLPYVNLEVELGRDEDVWVRALDFRPENRQVLHHLLIYVHPPAGAPRRRGELNLLGGYGPGKAAQVLPEGTGRFLAAGTILQMQLHYTTIGKATSDATEVALYLHDRPPPHRLKTWQISNSRFVIPPRAPSHRVSALSRPFHEDVLARSFTPHMHLRGKSMRYTARFPDGREELLFSVPDFSFDWQMKYTLKEPLPLPAGTRILVEGTFDNSERNPANPDPDAEVRFGLESWDEMFIGYFNFTSAEPERRE